MRFDAPVLLYGAGREGARPAPSSSACARDKVYVTVDSGEADIEEAEFIPPTELQAAIESRRFATIVKSPGVSRYKPIFLVAREAGIAVTSNLNLWGEYFRDGRTVIAITGTKGKSTTATLVHLMLTWQASMPVSPAMSASRRSRSPTSTSSWYSNCRATRPPTWRSRPNRRR